MIKNFLDARKMLLKACNGYIQHNQQQLNGLKLQNPCSWPTSDYYFMNALGKCNPSPGFKDWICDTYYHSLEHILGIFHKKGNVYKYHDGRYEFEEMKWWQESQTIYYEEDVDHSAPETVLHNLNAMLNLLNFHMESWFPKLNQQKIALKYHKYDLTTQNDEPHSIQLYKTFENLKLRAHLTAFIAKKNIGTSDLNSLINLLEKMTPEFEGYIKGIAIRELKATLDNTDLDATEAVKRIEKQLKNGVTFALLMKDRQSKREHDLKLLSVISICVGIGIFTTLGLIFKRLYDSGGASINFFKPLSQNLYEKMEGTIANLGTDVSP